MYVIVGQLENPSGSTAKHVQIRKLQTIQLMIWTEALRDQRV